MVTLRLLWHGVAGAFVKGQASGCDIVLLTKCHDVPGVDETGRDPYLVVYRRYWWRAERGSLVVEQEITAVGVVRTKCDLKFNLNYNCIGKTKLQCAAALDTLVVTLWLGNWCGSTNICTFSSKYMQHSSINLKQNDIRIYATVHVE